jgi:type IV secretory pathway VirB4 component
MRTVDASEIRCLELLNTNYADLSFLFALHTGQTHNAHLDTEYLAVLETNSSTPYFLNLHYQCIAHTMILGATGSGKSFFLNFLITNLQKYQPVLLGNFNLSEIMGVAQKSKSDSPSQC